MRLHATPCAAVPHAPDFLSSTLFAPPPGCLATCLADASRVMTPHATPGRSVAMRGYPAFGSATPFARSSSTTSQMASAPLGPYVDRCHGQRNDDGHSPAQRPQRAKRTSSNDLDRFIVQSGITDGRSMAGTAPTDFRLPKRSTPGRSIAASGYPASFRDSIPSADHRGDDGASRPRLLDRG